MSLGQRRAVQVEATEQDKNDALFFDAVMKGNMKQAQWFRDKGADVRKPSGAHTPLRAAALQGHVHVVRWLVEECAVSVVEDQRVLCIVALSQTPSQELFSYLVDKGADPAREDETLGTPLVLALGQGHEDFALWMIDKYALNCSQQGNSKEHSSPLHKACAACSAKMVAHLMDARGAGTCLELTDVQNYTPLMLAVKEKRVETVELLLAKYKANANVCTDTSALFIAAEEGYAPTARALLQHGADPNVRHPKMEIAPVHIAASNDHVYVVEELIKHKAALDVFSGKGYTPLIMACSQGYTRVTQQLIDAGANVNVVSPLDGATALHHAVTGGFLACTQLLIASGKCDLTIQDNGQMTPEHCAHAMLEETRKKGDAAGVRTFQALVNYFATLGQQGNSKCAACFKALDPAERKRCGRCKAIWYCSAACQKNHWSAHKGECKDK